ncbi:MAG TPA: hypothetical protein VK601_18460 [Kofleriaceae bacterium]|nr:hypothetical protein [Kofleriaceae bacterium]
MELALGRTVDGERVAACALDLAGSEARSGATRRGERRRASRSWRVCGTAVAAARRVGFRVLSRDGVRHGRAVV